MCLKPNMFLQCIEAGIALSGAFEVSATGKCRKAGDKCTVGFKAHSVCEKLTKACTTTKITDIQGLLVRLSLYPPQSA